MRTLILIDDEAPLRKVARQILHRFGTETLEASDGLEGIELVLGNRERNPAVLLDLTMPKMGGRDVLARLRREAPEIPIVLMSGYVDDAELSDRIASSGIPLIEKPYRAAALGHQVSTVFEARQARPARSRTLSRES
jgi:two-component system cell cycle sensor histidine kinase/response regulator CckA